MHKRYNEWIWGAWGGIGCAIFALIADLVGSPMHQSVLTAGSAGFFWFWVIAMVKNWLASRPVR